MYGLVNRAVEGLISSKFGTEKWNEIAQRANVGRCPFLSMRSYADAITFDLVKAASEVLEIPPSQVLEAFGEHWILFTADEGYGQLAEHCGSTLREFLLNLDSLHSRVGMIFPALQPPEFRSTEQPDRSIRMEYYSTREGLAPMVTGLIRGLAKRFSTEISLEILPPEEPGSWQATFLVQLHG